MKCFIASALGHDDVDAIYDQCVIPTLNKLSVTPLRVDKIVHNEDIDNKIFELLDSADIVIADLTYARPSVYYEAGYATGKLIPVIYIVKSDHFKVRNDDLYGNFRVHFDLQMKNIIPWTVPNSEFSEKLLKRVRVVLQPLVRVNTQNLKLVAERSEFNRLPMTGRLRIILETGINLLRKRSFRRFQLRTEAYYRTEPTFEAYLIRVNKTRSQGVGIITTSSVSKQLLDNLSWNSLFIQYPDDPDKFQREAHYIIASLKSVPRSRITISFPDFHPRNNTTMISENTKSLGNHTEINYIHIIDGIKSKSEFATKFRSVIEENCLSKDA